MTGDPLGVRRRIRFKAGHRTADRLQAGLTSAARLLFGFHRDPEANCFYGQAVSGGGVVTATDWDAPAR